MWHKDMQGRPFKMAALSSMTVTRRDLVAERKAAERIKEFTDDLVKQIYNSMAMSPSPDRILMQNCRCIVKPLDESIKVG